MPNRCVCLHERSLCPGAQCEFTKFCQNVWPSTGGRAAAQSASVLCWTGSERSALTQSPLKSLDFNWLGFAKNKKRANRAGEPRFIWFASVLAISSNNPGKWPWAGPDPYPVNSTWSHAKTGFHSPTQNSKRSGRPTNRFLSLAIVLVGKNAGFAFEWHNKLPV